MRIWGGVLLAVLAVGFGWAGSAIGQARDQAQVTVSIRVDPMAQVMVPQGGNFAIVVPPARCLPLFRFSRHGCALWWQHWWPPILPVRIPFTVTGNALAAVSARPDAFMRIWTGRYLGRAVRPGGGTLGYHLILQFPVPESYHWLLDWTEWSDWNAWRHWQGYGALPEWSQFAQLPGLDGAGTPPLTANLVRRGGTAYGVIYAVAAHGWTADGRLPAPGSYHGSVEMTVTSAQ